MRYALLWFLCISATNPLLAAPQSASAAYGGVVAGEAMCSLQRQGVSESGIREEYNRITSNLKVRGLLLAADQPAYLKSIRQILSGCIRRNPAI